MNSVLLTGSSGFIGRNLLKLLLNNNFDVFTPSSKEYDLTKENDVERIFKYKKFDSVIHLAADVGGIKMIKSNHGRIFYNNVMMNTLIMEKSRAYGIKKFICLNTINCYPENNKILNEDHIWNGFPNKDTFSYGIAKRTILAQALCYKEQYNFDSINLIIDNTYGPYDNFDLNNSRVIPALINKFYNAVQNNISVVDVWGSGKSIRQFLYVEDLAEIIKSVLVSDVSNDIINISNAQSISIKNLAENISRILCYKGNINFDSSKPEGAVARLMDNKKMKDIIKFNNFNLINEGLQKTIDWYTSIKNEKK